MRSLHELLQHCRIPSPYFAVENHGNTVGAVVDVNDDGNDDGLVLCVIGRKSIRDLAELSKEKRLYEDTYQSFELAVLVFSYDSASDTEHPEFIEKVMPIGVFRVLKGFAAIDLGRDMPSAYEVVSMNDNSSVRNWIICNQQLSTFKLIDSPKKSASVKDIDGDGITDVILYDKVFEEGSGEETFLSWYRWNGSSYVEYSSTNIVRNLNSFLYQVSNLVERKNWNRFTRYALDNTVQTSLRDSSASNAQKFEGVFSPVRPGTRINPMEIKSVKFQEILENPFHDSVRQVTVSCKIATNDDVFFSVDVLLSQNPFIQPQYTLVWNLAP